jgi:hypothetical protein
MLMHALHLFGPEPQIIASGIAAQFTGTIEEAAPWHARILIDHHCRQHWPLLMDFGPVNIIQQPPDHCIEVWLPAIDPTIWSDLTVRGKGLTPCDFLKSINQLF